jgi:class 3 adenylate cyclase
VLAEVEDVVEVEPLGTLALKGFGRPVEAFAVVELARVAA